jgi:glutamate synthase (NADPH/NADH) small chain
VRRRSTASIDAVGPNARARTEEVHHAEEEGVEFHWLTNPVEILDDGKGDVRGMRCVRMELAEPDDSGRRRPIAIAGSEHDIDVDLVVFAIGTNANPIMGQTSKLRLNKRGYIDTDADLATSVAGVFAGGGHRHRRCHGDRGDGCRPQSGARHEGLSRPA